MRITARAAAAALAAVSVGLLLGSCAGAPAARASADDPFADLGAGARAYALCDVRALRPLLDEALAGSEKARGSVEVSRAAAALDRTDAASAAWFGAEAPRFRFRAFGSYPRFASALSLTFDRDWKRVGGERPYWRSSRGFSLAFERDGSVLFSDGSPWSVARAPMPDPSFFALSEDSALRVWLPEPAAFVSRALGPGGESLRLPLVSLAAGISPSGDAWRLDFVARSASEREARALVSILRFAGAFARRDAADPRFALLGRILGSGFTQTGDTVSVSIDGIDRKYLSSLLGDLFGTLL